MEENNNITISCTPPVKTKRKKKKRTRSSIFYVDNINIDKNDDNILINSNSPDSQSDNISILTTDSNTSTMSSAAVSIPTTYTTNDDESLATTTSNSLTLNSSSTSLHFTLSINSTSACQTDNIHDKDVKEENSLIELNYELDDDNVVAAQPKLNYVQQLRLKFEKLSFAQQPQDDRQKLLNSYSKFSTPRGSLRKFVRCNSNNNANHNDSANCNNNNNNNVDNQTTEKFTWKHFNTIHSRFIKRRSSNVANNIIINNSIPNNTNLNNNINKNNVEIPSEEEVDDITTDDIVELSIKNSSYLEAAIKELSRNSMAGELTDLEVKNLSNKSLETNENVLSPEHEKVPSILIDECPTESGSGSGSSAQTNNDSNQKVVYTDAVNSKNKVIKPKRTKKRNRSANRPKTEVYEAKNYNIHMLKSHSYTEHRLESESDEDFENGKYKSLSNERIHLNFTYDSKDIPPSIEELIRTEQRYIQTLKNGIKNYGKIFENSNCPKGLKGKKFDLLGNINEIMELHQNIVLPMLEKNQNNLQKMFEEFIELIEDNTFYSYVLFTINKRKSSKLCEQFCSYFKELQIERKDTLGIISFLVQPIQRLPRYQLLFNEFLKQSFGNFDYRSAAGVCAKLEKRIGSFIVMLNESEEINAIEECFDLNIFHQGHFKKSNEFQVYDYSSGRYYRSKAFIFERNLIYTEIKKDRLIYRGSYPYNKIGFIPKSDTITVFYERRKRQECDFKSDSDIIQNWIKLITSMSQLFADEEKQRLQEKYSAKMKTNDNDNIYRKTHNTLIFRNSNRTSADSGISGMTTPINTIEEGSPNTTWYDTM